MIRKNLLVIALGLGSSFLLLGVDFSVDLKYTRSYQGSSKVTLRSCAMIHEPSGDVLQVKLTFKC